MPIKSLATAALLLALSIFLVGPVAAQPSGSYHAYLIQNMTPYSDTLTFTANSGTPHEGVVSSNQLGSGEFHYSSSEQMVLMIFSQQLAGSPNFVLAGKMVGAQWQGVLSIDQSNGAVWVAQRDAFTPDLNDYGPAINLAKDSANPQGKTYNGAETNPSQSLSFRLTNGVSSAGIAKEFGSVPGTGLTGHFASFTYTAANSQLVVIGVPGNRVYGAVVRDLGAGVIELEGAWFNANGNLSGSFLVHH